ncbi:MAG TPA: DUF2723 domain-containing protein [Candidatus Eisenbacteria bacterium]|nr:DUF2723 domain-containing protein [Candidatus Eisenbacteria bacterium]
MGPSEERAAAPHAAGAMPGAATGAAVALGLGAFAWGLLLAPRGYAEGDGSELTLTLATAAVPHPTGYPLYSLAGHLFVRIAHAAGMSWPAAANAWSAAGAALAAYFLARLAGALAAERLAASGRGGRGGPGASLPLLLALSPLAILLAQPIWSLAATQAEVTSWHAAWVAAATWAAWRLAARPPVAPRGALLWGAVAGAGLAHHATSVLVSLPLTLWLARRRSAPRSLPLLAPFLAGLAIPLASFAWVAWRAVSPAPGQWPLLEAGFDGFVAHVTGRAFGGYLGGFNPAPPEAALLLTALPWLAVALPLLAVAAFARDAGPVRSFARALGAVAILQGAFLLAYRVPDPSWLALPLLVAGTAWVPRGLAALTARAGVATAALVVAAAAVAFLPSWASRDLEAKRSAEATDRIVREAWESVPFERGLVAWNNDLEPRLRAYQLLEGSHAARVVEHPGMLSWEGPRRAFRDRMGFDPWGGGLPEREEELAARLVETAAAAGLPSLDFDDAIRFVTRTRPRSPTPR